MNEVCAHLYYTLYKDRHPDTVLSTDQHQVNQGGLVISHSSTGEYSENDGRESVDREGIRNPVQLVK